MKIAWVSALQCKPNFLVDMCMRFSAIPKNARVFLQLFCFDLHMHFKEAGHSMTTARPPPPGGATQEWRGQSSMRPKTPGSSPGDSHSALTTSECTNKKHLDCWLQLHHMNIYNVPEQNSSLSRKCCFKGLHGNIWVLYYIWDNIRSMLSRPVALVPVSSRKNA